MIYFKRSNQKFTVDVAYLFVDGKIFSVIQVSLTDIYIFAVRIFGYEVFTWEVYDTYGMDVFQISLAHP